MHHGAMGWLLINSIDRRKEITPSVVCLKLMDPCWWEMLRKRQLRMDPDNVWSVSRHMGTSDLPEFHEFVP